MTIIEIKVDEDQLKKLVLDFIQNKMGDLPLDNSKVSIQVKSKQNYRSEWEEASFKAIYTHTL